ncbi:retinal cone rhodopsin-sensitive cGMP 3',5'-cyclic phosphodiesterase subunit gamma isoform X1 [Sus scrofa]|nr:retinal cone rhodopsin-sensitive cGMP 3',5'-cyclic phosphodiesterase subunit gamma isoform X1 [Sus scrofa]
MTLMLLDVKKPVNGERERGSGASSGYLTASSEALLWICSVDKVPSCLLKNRLVSLRGASKTTTSHPRAFRMSDNTTLAPPTSNQGPTTPRKGPPKFKQRQTRQFKSKPPKKGVKGFGDDIPGMEGLGTDITVICPWEAFSHLELHELAQFGII